MRINSIQNYQYSNYSVQNRVQNPYFTGSEKTTKSSSQGIITIEGLYKKFPEHAAEVIKALNENATAVDFIKKYNVEF